MTKNTVIYLYSDFNLTSTFDDVTDDKSMKKPDRLNGRKEASPGRLLHSTNDVNRLNCSMDGNDFINTTVSRVVIFWS